MSGSQSIGKCALCGAESTKAGMTRHLAACRREHAATAKANPVPALLLRVQGHHLPNYWMDLEMRAAAKLGDLDDFLRESWLECCGHLSSFTVDGVQYTRDTGQVDSVWMMFRDAPQQRRMSIRVGELLHLGTKFTHEYDFGTTTTLAGRVVSQDQAVFPARTKVKILARNNPPRIPCSACGEPAVSMCAECAQEDDEGCLCQAHARTHKCGSEMLLPIVNSPRVGQCGYTGPSHPKAFFNS